MKLELSLISYTKLNSKWIKDLDLRLDTIKPLEENISRTLSDINHSKIFFYLPPRIMKTKIKINGAKLKNSCTAKQTISKMKRQPSERDKILQMKKPTKG